MGVHGLWKLLEPTGKLVPLDTMNNKVLAVDVSMWLHQAMQGMREGRGITPSIAHLLVLFHRLCKLLFYKIKPVFVFDGGVPALKRQTMAMRRARKATAKSEANKVRNRLLKNIAKHRALKQVQQIATFDDLNNLGGLALPGPQVEEDLFKLPPVAIQKVESSSDEEEVLVENGEDFLDIHSVDLNSAEWKNLPSAIRHELLCELLETRKHGSWRQLDSMPKQAPDFSDFQMSRLLKRRAVQAELEQAGTELKQNDLTLVQLNDMLQFEGYFGQVQSGKIAQDDQTNYMLLKNKTSIQPRLCTVEDIINVLEDKPENEVEDVDMTEQQAILASLQPKSECESEVVNDVEKTGGSLQSDSKSEFNQLTENDEKTGAALQSDQKSEFKQLTENIEKTGATLQSNTKSELEQLVENVKMICPSFTPELEGERDKSIEMVEKTGEDFGLSNEDNDVKQNISQKGFIGHQELKAVVQLKENKDDKKIMTKDDNLIVKNMENVIGEFQNNVDLNKIKETTENSDSMPALRTLENFVEGDSVEHQGTTEIPSKISSPTQIADEVQGELGNQNIISNKTTTSSKDVTAIEFIESTIDNTATFSQNTERVCMEKVGTPEQKAPIEPQPETSDRLKVWSELIAMESSSKNVPDIMSSSSSDEEEKDLVHVKPPLDPKHIDDMNVALLLEQNELMKEQERQQRLARQLTDQMCADVQELLRLFGVPWVVAPMEAEAQCAELELLGLTSGTITDDSDIWLFGGRTVYRNFFDQKRHVVEFRSEDISHLLKLSREQMVLLALLVGSDYTTGVAGVGPVTAMEVLSIFRETSAPPMEGLKKFRSWVSDGCPAGPYGKTSLSGKLRNVKLTPGFPSPQVYSAYINPAVDSSKESFSWAKPDLPKLISYTKQKFGWHGEQCRSQIEPILKRLNETTVQTNIKNYFLTNSSPSTSAEQLGKLSKRILTAVERFDKDVIPQKIQKMNEMEERKRKAAAVLRKKNVNKKKRVLAKEVNLSSDSSD